MADEEVYEEIEFDEEDLEGTIEVSDLMDKIMNYAVDEAKQKMASVGEFAPFTCVVKDEQLYFETHPGEDTDECFASAAEAIAKIEGYEAYALAYDGYVESDNGDLDAIIIECAEAGDDKRMIFAVLYDQTEEGYVFQEPAFLDILMLDEE